MLIKVASTSGHTENIHAKCSPLAATAPSREDKISTTYVTVL